MIGQTISHYRIVEQIGEGGMGVVYKAEDTRLGRQVAIKVLASHLYTNESAKRRFINEARAAAAVDHPNISTVFEVDETPDGRVFIVMALYSGETLRDKIARGPLPVDEALALTAQIAAGLVAVHEKGIVHRDIKPGNIIVTESGTAKLVDFGLAQLRDVTKITKSGTTVGTLSYMSPEQARGDEVDARSDIFSLGCVLYELITGRAAFGDAHDAAVLYAIVHEPPSTMVKYRNDVPADVQRIVDRMLAKNPKERYPSIRGVLRDIEAVGDGSARTKPTAKVRRLSLWAGLFVVLAIGAAVTWKSRRESATPAPGTHSLAIIDFRDLEASQQQNLSASLTGLLQIGLIESAPCRVVSAEYLYDLRRRLFGSNTGPITPEQALEVARKSGADVLLTGQCASEGTGYYVAWQLVDTHDGAGLGARRVEGEAMTSLADDVIGGVLPLLALRCGDKAAPQQIPVASLTTSSTDAYTRYVAGLTALESMRRDDAIHEFRAAVSIDSTFALAWFGLARAYGGHNDTERRDEGKPGCAAGEQAWGLRSRLGIKDRMLLEAWLARTCRDDMVGAIETHRELVARWPDDRDALYHLVEMLCWIHLGGEAVPIARNALAKYPNDLKLKGISAWALQSVGHVREALTLHEQIAAMQSRDPSSWDGVGTDYIALGLPDSADVAFRRALALDPNFAASAINMAMSPFYRGDTPRAIDGLRRLQTKIPEEDQGEVVTDIGQLLAERGHFQEAFDLNRYPFPFNRANPKYYLHFLLAPDPRRRNELTEGLNSAIELKAKAQTPYSEFRACWSVVNAALLADSVELARPSLQRMEQLVGHLFPRNAYWWMTCAEFALADGKPADALRYLDDVDRTAFWPGNTFDIYRRTYKARAYRMLGRNNDVIRELKELKRFYAGHYLADYELAQVYDEMKRPADAVASYSTFLAEWSDADSGLVQVRHARERLTALKQAP